MNIHTTELSTFLRCRRLWNWTSPNRENLEKITMAPYLALGTLVHKALEDWCLSPTDDLTSLYRTRAEASVESVKAVYAMRVGVSISDNELDPIITAVALGASMMANYQDYYTRPLPVGWTLVASEREFSIPIPGTTHFFCGRIDKILADTMGRLYPLDTKTYSQQPSDDTIQFNPQFLYYTLALRLLYPEKSVAGFLFDGCRKRASPARGKSTSDLFYRKVFYRTEHELEEAYRNLTVLALEMEHAAIYPNRTWTCHIDCSFNSLCAAESRGDDVDYLRARLTQPRRSAEIEKEEIE